MTYLLEIIKMTKFYKRPKNVNGFSAMEQVKSIKEAQLSQRGRAEFRVVVNHVRSLKVIQNCATK